MRTWRKLSREQAYETKGQEVLTKTSQDNVGVITRAMLLRNNVIPHLCSMLSRLLVQILLLGKGPVMYHEKKWLKKVLLSSIGY